MSAVDRALPIHSIKISLINNEREEQETNKLSKLRPLNRVKYPKALPRGALQRCSRQLELDLHLSHLDLNTEKEGKRD